VVVTQDILDMYVHLRKTNFGISDEAIEFMKDCCLDNLSDKKESIICTDFTLVATDIKGRKKKVLQPPNGNIFTVFISDR